VKTRKHGNSVHGYYNGQSAAKPLKASPFVESLSFSRLNVFCFPFSQPYSSFLILYFSTEKTRDESMSRVETWKADREGKFEIDQIEALFKQAGGHNKRGRDRKNPKSVSQAVKFLLKRAVKPQQQLPAGLPVTPCLFLKDNGQLPKGISYKAGSLTCELSLPSLFRFKDGVLVGDDRTTPKVPVQQLIYAYHSWKKPSEWDAMSMPEQWKLFLTEWKPHFKASGGVVMHFCDCNSCINPSHMTLSTTKTNLDNASCEGYHLYDDRLIRVCPHEPVCNRVFVRPGQVTTLTVTKEQHKALSTMAKSQQTVRAVQRARGQKAEAKKKSSKKRKADTDGAVSNNVFKIKKKKG
jgi:hypothetical protein